MLNWIKSLTKTQKRTVLLIGDGILVPAALVFALVAVSVPGGVWGNFVAYLPIMPYVMAVGVGVSLWFGISSIQLNAYEGDAITMTGVLALLLTISSVVFSNIAGLGLPFGVHLVFGAAYFGFVVASRAMLLQLVLELYSRDTSRCRVLIYGAGTTGTQLATALRSDRGIEPVAFVDDGPSLQGLRINRLPVYNPLRIASVVEEHRIDRVVLALPSLSLPKQAQIVQELERMGLEVQTLPSFAQLIGSEALVDRLTPVSAQSFLNRQEVRAALGEGQHCYADKTVLISGAGGSIGSELCRQVLACGPAKLVLYELSELALYNVHMELTQIAADTGAQIVPVLGSVTDARQVRRVLDDHGVQVVLHAAAYKHVPLVEANPLVGLANNVFGTQRLAQCAADAGVERFILISSDKAVRPANIMGASKRLAEQVVQDLSRRQPVGRGTIFSMVRFGNVLGSSGSVVPLFQEQLARGGPLTVTDRNVTRFFMTVQEAVSLVLQAGSIARGGEVFVLDMGKPVSIMTLARQVVETAGFTVRDDDNPDGDIEIKITGLRPGEKLTEELTLSGVLLGTTLPKIYAAREDGLSEIEVASALRQLNEAFDLGDETMALALIDRWVEGYRSVAVPVPESDQTELSRHAGMPPSTPLGG